MATPLPEHLIAWPAGAERDGVTVRDQSGPAAGWDHRRPGPAEALADLLAGNRRFVAGRPRYGHDVSAPRARTAEHQPWALVVGCLDSRVPPEAVLDQDFGSLVVVRTGGHVLDEAVLGSVEFAVSVFGVPLVLVLGHQYCGAVAATIKAVGTASRPAGALGRLVEAIEPAVHEAAGSAELATDRHVGRTVDDLLELPAVREGCASGQLAVIGARYQIDTGEVSLLRRLGA
jgi:carbonic anhydrase